MRKIVFSLMSLLLISLVFQTGLFACTAAIFTGKVTADGRPLLWKHRDTGEENNRIEFFQGEQYSFLGLVDSPSEGGEVWAGTNNVGFSIMNTASYNIKDDDIKEMDKEGVLMFKALSQCRTLAEFERFLDDYPRPMRVEANFGVIDAEGGAAFYEVNNTSWIKFDANDSQTTPEGYLVYTNFSFSGRTDKGMGYIRHQNAQNIVTKAIGSGEAITPHWIFKALSRSFYHSLQGINLVEECFPMSGRTAWVIDQDYIPRKSTAASVVFQGIKPGESPEMTIMWTVLGYPPAGVAVPLWVAAGMDQPTIMLKSENSHNALACNLALELKHKTFSMTRGNGGRYMNFSLIYNNSGTGYMQEQAFAEEMVASLFGEKIEFWRKNGLNLNELREINRDVSEMIPRFYRELTVNQSLEDAVERQ